MAGSTRHYGLGFFDFGDPLGTNFAGQLEIDRFVFIDKQLFGLMSIFGNGVIEGWTVAAEESFTVSVGEGFGNINFTAARTTFPANVINIPPNATNFVYARLKERTAFAEDIEFILSPTSNLTDPNFLLLASVTTGPLSVESVDNTIRSDIGFVELIRAAISLHKHRGGSENPTKIDLASEVKGQLPSFRIADFDAVKVTSGTFDLARIPLIDHQDLDNVGLLTHPQLDTFVKTLEASNKELFGEIATANILQIIIAAKFIYDDPDSAFYIPARDFDDNMVNEITLIPGITPNTYIDFDNTTAEVNLTEHFIRGIPPTTGTSFFVNFDTGLAWRSAFSSQNLLVVGDSVSLAFNDDEESNIVTIEGFESATEPGQSLTANNLFKKETIIIADNADITASSTSTNVIEGFFSGDFTNKISFRNQYVKEFATAQDWVTFDSFVLHIKNLSAIHGAVKLYFESSTGVKSVEFVILDQDEVTDNSEPGSNNFELRVINLTSVPFRNDVKKFVIFTDDLINPFNFFVDFINIQRAILLPESGTMKLRFSSANTVTFAHIAWVSTEPPGTDINIRARAANGTVFLNRAEFTPILTNGEIINLNGTDIEIEITLLPDGDRILSPVLHSLRILVISEAETDGFIVNTAAEFSRGSSENITINSSPTSLSLTTPIPVDSYYFLLGNLATQIHEDTSVSPSFVESEISISGLTTPIAPNQVFKSIEENPDTGAAVRSAKLFDPRSVRRQVSRTFVIADTYNDRILEIDENGTLIAGIGSINYEHDTLIFPIAASVDTRTGILYIVWSRVIQFKTVNVSKITLQTASQKVQIIKDFDKILGLSTSELEAVEAEGQIMPIHLSEQNAGLAELLPATDSFMLASSDVISTGIQTDSVFYKRLVTTLGIPVFIGKFAYIDGIFTPTWAEKTEDDGFIVANGTVAIKDYDIDVTNESISRNTTPSSVIEVDKNNNVIFGSNAILFSPFIPGRAERIDANTILLGGIKPGGVEGTPETNNPFDFRSFSGDSAIRVNQKKALNQIFFKGTTPFSGAVLLLDTRAGATTFEYISPEGILVSDVDIDPRDGQFVVAESGFDKTGRIIKVDSTGNIFFSTGEGLYSIINDLEVQQDGSIVIST